MYYSTLCSTESTMMRQPQKRLSTVHSVPKRRCSPSQQRANKETREGQQSIENAGLWATWNAFPRHMSLQVLEVYALT